MLENLLSPWDFVNSELVRTPSHAAKDRGITYRFLSRRYSTWWPHVLWQKGNGKCCFLYSVSAHHLGIGYTKRWYTYVYWVVSPLHPVRCNYPWFCLTLFAGAIPFRLLHSVLTCTFPVGILCARCDYLCLHVSYFILFLARRVGTEDQDPEAALRIAGEIGRMVATMHDAQVSQEALELFSMVPGLHATGNPLPPRPPPASLPVV